MSQRHLRRRYFIDKQVQGALLATTIRHWLISVTLVVLVTLLGWSINSAGIEGLADFRQQMSNLVTGLLIAVLATLLVMPLIIIDLIRMSHRFAGPMFRLRRAMNQFADGQPVEPIRFRENDFWQEFADAFNRMLVRIERLECAKTPVQDRGDAQANECPQTNGELADTMLR